MRYLALIFISVFFLSACNDSSKSQEEVVVNEAVVADSESKLAVEGMVCSMGCVSAIQDKLRSTEGVSTALVNYEGSFASISYDSKLVSEEELIAAIGSIGDHSYSAKVFTEEEVEETIEETMDEVDEAVEAAVEVIDMVH